MADGKIIIVGVGAGFAGFLLGAITFGGGTADRAGASNDVEQVAQEPAADVAATTNVEVAEPAPEAEPSQPPSDWFISENVEAMTDQVIKTACTTSRNRIQVDFPYGARSGRLCIRQHPRFGQDAYVSLDGSGQILCTSYSGCTIRVRFDDGAVQSFSANGPSDNSTETVFVSNTTRFISAARNAERIRIQLEFYQNGVQTFDFPARGLVW